MKILPVLATLLSVVFGVFLLTVVKAAPPTSVPAEVHYIGHDDVAATLAKSGFLVKESGVAVQAVQRGPGAVEYHEHTSHIYFMVDGEATFVVGGTMIDPKRTAPDQLRSPTADGGTTYHLTKGDVITVPAKTPHWFKDMPSGKISYYLVSIETE
jgi:mannose-6-phosphate isomerase-like protein (cupin superfamily)